MGLIYNGKVEETKILEAYGLTLYGKINTYDWSSRGHERTKALITLRITDLDDNEVFNMRLGNNCILQSRIDDTLDNFLFWISEDHPNKNAIEKQVYDSLCQSNSLFNKIIMSKKIRKIREEKEKKERERGEKEKDMFLAAIKKYCEEEGFFLFFIRNEEGYILKPLNERGKRYLQHVVEGTYNDKEIIINFVKNYPENKEVKLIKDGILKELFEYVNGGNHEKK